MITYSNEEYTDMILALDACNSNVSMASDYCRYRQQNCWHLHLLEDLVQTPVNLIFQQDGAPSCFGRFIRDFLNNKHPSWISREVMWPVQFPDIILMNFYLWNHITFLVNDEIIREKMLFVLEHFETKSTLKNVLINVVQGTQLCWQKKERHF